MDHRSSRHRRRQDLDRRMRRRGNHERLDPRHVGEGDLVKKRTHLHKPRRDTSQQDIGGAEATHNENDQASKDTFVRQWLNRIDPQHGLSLLHSDPAHNRNHALDASRKRLALSPMPPYPPRPGRGASFGPLVFHDGHLRIKNDLGWSDEPASYEYQKVEDFHNRRLRAERSNHPRRGRSPSPAFERRPRRKTRQDRYESKDASRGSKNKPRGEKPLHPQRRQASKNKRMPSGRHMMDNFASGAVLNDRLTVNILIYPQHQIHMI